MIIFNLSLLSGTYPLSKLCCSNSRPIFLSLSLSKVFEKCIKVKVMKFLDDKTFLSKN